jgi:carboxyl-terminal processing protease
VNEVAVDLRYNGGGYVSVQEKFADYLANAAANGNVMMTEKYNDKYSDYNYTTRFQKKGSLNLSRVFFIVSKNTASASELLINNLKPYLDVKLVGPQNTYGKPVGFFPYPVGDWYVFPVSFRSTNKNGEGNYFNGLTINGQVADGLDKNWGDKTETDLAAVLNYVSTGSFGTGTTPASAKSAAELRAASGNDKLDIRSFKGAVDLRRTK